MRFPTSTSSASSWTRARPREAERRTKWPRSRLFLHGRATTPPSVSSCADRFPSHRYSRTPSADLHGSAAIRRPDLHPVGGCRHIWILKQKAAAISSPKRTGLLQLKRIKSLLSTRARKERERVFRLNYITSAGPFTAANDRSRSPRPDYILLAPNNYFVTSKGHLGQRRLRRGHGPCGRAGEPLRPWTWTTPDSRRSNRVGDVAQIESSAGFMGGGTDTQGDYLQIGPTAPAWAPCGTIRTLPGG